TGSADGLFDLQFSFDAAERLLQVQDADPASTSSPKARRLLKSFIYDGTSGYSWCTSGKCAGKLVQSVRHNYFDDLGDVSLTDYFHYDGLGGRPSEHDWQVSLSTGVQAFAQTQTYNDLGLLNLLTYPCHALPTTFVCGDSTKTLTHTYANG